MTLKKLDFNDFLWDTSEEENNESKTQEKQSK